MDRLSRAYFHVDPAGKAAFEARLRAQGANEANIASLRNADFTRAR